MTRGLPLTTHVRHQAVRWINTKEEHAARILDNMSNYILAQRVKPPAEATGHKQDQYVKLLLVCLLVCVICVYISCATHAQASRAQLAGTTKPALWNACPPSLPPRNNRAAAGLAAINQDRSGIEIQ